MDERLVEIGFAGTRKELLGSADQQRKRMLTAKRWSLGCSALGASFIVYLVAGVVNHPINFSVSYLAAPFACAILGFIFLRAGRRVGEWRWVLTCRGFKSLQLADSNMPSILFRSLVSGGGYFAILGENGRGTSTTPISGQPVIEIVKGIALLQPPFMNVINEWLETQTRVVVVKPTQHGEWHLRDLWKNENLSIILAMEVLPTMIYQKDAIKRIKVLVAIQAIAGLLRNARASNHGMPTLDEVTNRIETDLAAKADELEAAKRITFLEAKNLRLLSLAAQQSSERKIKVEKPESWIHRLANSDYAPIVVPLSKHLEEQVQQAIEF